MGRRREWRSAERMQAMTIFWLISIFTDVVFSGGGMAPTVHLVPGAEYLATPLLAFE